MTFGDRHLFSLTGFSQPAGQILSAGHAKIPFVHPSCSGRSFYRFVIPVFVSCEKIFNYRPVAIVRQVLASGQMNNILNAICNIFGGKNNRWPEKALGSQIRAGGCGFCIVRPLDLLGPLRVHPLPLPFRDYRLKGKCNFFRVAVFVDDIHFQFAHVTGLGSVI
ncbi:hypothetical protein CEXT_657021 [Caerostris extrusa]|uniref:Uncharacterized protein n=1 Tax=Caerostris extrusa TaxID=172846 RepID=A0AAV4M6J1_CAEEX|nr:hypothetical protein CEXT_657021 [Caerostris extrusa]